MNLYLWIKSFHIIFMVAWFAGLFYVFRLFVYHVKFRDKPGMAEAYVLMERKLLYMIMHPSMLGTIAFGATLLYLNPDLLQMHWLHAKLGFVLLLMGYQFFAGATHRKFKKGNYFLSEKACRVINEVPALLLIAIVLLVVLKPRF
ncbi:MAG: protoporphyrinogen oxidase HemJ [bacterium]